MARVRYPREILAAVVEQAEAAYPRECCGILAGYRRRDGRVEVVSVHQMENVYDRYHAADPAAYPRDARTAYLMDPRQQSRLMEALEAGGTPPVCIYHSHVDVGAYFSEEDERAALFDGAPLYPDVEYLVVGVEAGRATEARAFHWDGASFVGRDVDLEGE